MDNSNFGTREWSVKTVNCCDGCSHDCRYCYARSMAVRFKRRTVEDWHQERIRPRDLAKQHKNYSGAVMFPSSHDITPGTLDACLQVIERLLLAGNHVLIVSKPHLDCIKTICHRFTDHRQSILFRFTIGADSDEVLRFWEPGAPAYLERKAALAHAFNAGFQTSVSCEPMLDSSGIDRLLSDLLPYVTETVWIGKMNHVGHMRNGASPEMLKALEIITAGQTDEIIKSIYERHKDNQKIMWKESITKVLQRRHLNESQREMKE